MRVAIHQPNFFPWLGYFKKIALSDVFIFLDDAEIQKTGSTWTNRALIYGPNGDQWITAPLSRESKKLGTIADVTFQDLPWREKLQTTIKYTYAKTEFYGTFGTQMQDLLANPEQNLSRFNSFAIQSIYKELGMPTPEIVFSSELGVEATSTNRLVMLCQKVGATEYLYGGGAQNYQEDHMFESAGITPTAMGYQPSPSLSANPENSGYSIIDSLLRFGPDAIRKHLSPS